MLEGQRGEFKEALNDRALPLLGFRRGPLGPRGLGREGIVVFRAWDEEVPEGDDRPSTCSAAGPW